MNTKDVAQISNLSVRTLHHYDRIGLLCPQRNPLNDYRDYSSADLDRLQQILFFKECGFSLSNIQKMINDPLFDKGKAFALHRKYLLHEKKRLEAMLEMLDQLLKGEKIMQDTEKFKGFDMKDNPYEMEAKKIWGDEMVDQSKVYISSLSSEEQNAISLKMNLLFSSLAKLRHQDPASQEVQNSMEEMYQFFNCNFGYQYSIEAFGQLGQLYITDDRFQKNIDSYGEGLAEFLARAMKFYAIEKNP